MIDCVMKVARLIIVMDMVNNCAMLLHLATATKQIIFFLIMIMVVEMHVTNRNVSIDVVKFNNKIMYFMCTDRIHFTAVG